MHTDIVITNQSQPEVLKKKMEEKGIAHGQTTIVDLKKVKVSPLENSLSMEMRFCFMEGIDCKTVLSEGDEMHTLPRTVTVHRGLRIHNRLPGFYNLKNVILSSNGSIHIQETENTEWEAVPEAVCY